MSDFKLAIVYWFYKEPEVTRNHLELIRRHNPDRKIYGLYGGAPEQADNYEKLLGDLLDDFWVYPGTYGEDEYSKWIHGDLMLLDWYDKRGKDLDWDSVAILQWDMLLFTDIQSITPKLGKGQLFFSGYRVLDEAVENRWKWTMPDGDYRHQYEEFRDFVAQEYGYTERLKCCLYIYEVLTREFLSDYSNFSKKKIGMLEYKNPTLAYIFKHDIHIHDVGVFWRDWRQSAEASPLNAMKTAISEGYVRSELDKEGGWRLFHPYRDPWEVEKL